MIHFAYLKTLIDIIEIFYKETLSVIKNEKEEQYFLETFEKVFQIERIQTVENEQQEHQAHFSYHNINDVIIDSLERKIQQYQQENHIDITYVISVIPSRKLPCIYIVFPHEDKYISIVLSIEKKHNEYHVVLSTSDKENLYIIEFSDSLRKYRPIELQESAQNYSNISAPELIGSLMYIVM